MSDSEILSKKILNLPSKIEKVMVITILHSPKKALSSTWLPIYIILTESTVAEKQQIANKDLVTEEARYSGLIFY